jgi:MFS transporter, AAHS family, 3-hydroxyphenylpropionic acid transporter
MDHPNAGTPFRQATIVFCLLAALCEGIDLQAAGVAAAGIGAEFRLTPAEFGTFFSASTVGLFFGAILGGRLADSIGRKKVLVASVGFFGAFSLLTACAWDVHSLIVSRLLTGFGLGGALPMVLALVSEASPTKQQSASVAMVYAATPLGGAIISLISLIGLVSQWRVIFIVGGAVPLLLTPFMAFGLRESRAYQQVRDAPAMPRSGSFLAIFAEGRADRTALLWISFFLGLLLLYLLLNWLPTLLVTDGLTRSQAGAAQIGFNVGGALAAVAIGYLLAGRARGPAIALTFVALPLLLIGLAKAPSNMTIIFILVFGLGCAVIAAQAFLYATAPGIYPTSIRGVGVGLAVAMGRIGSIVGPKLGGHLKAAGHGPSQLLMDILPLVIVGSVCALLLAWRSPRN